jgi:membrane protease subunit (stomatin/prohibitin family)
MDVIESKLVNSDELIERFPAYGTGEIKWGSQLTVNDGEWAILFRDGKALEVFDSGRHVLTTQNIPVLTKLVTQFGYGPDSPFRSNVVFVAKRLFTNFKWGTPNPIVYRDPEINMIRLTAFGTLSIRIKDPLIFLNNLVGRHSAFSTKKIEEYLRSIISSKLAGTLGSSKISIFDMASQYSFISTKTKNESFQEFENVGIELIDLLINSINPPKSVQEIMDKKSSMSIISDMNQYMQFQTATSIEDAANNQSLAGLGVGAGAGFGLGMVLPQAMASSFNSEGNSQITSNSDSSFEEKLRTLKNLYDNELLTEDEYKAKREQVLGTL